MSISIVKPSKWAKALKEQFDAQYYSHIISSIEQQVNNGIVIYPPSSVIFHAFEMVAPNDVRVVILGQDPYHNLGEAMGLSFSVPVGTKVPPSLKNIYKELANDLGIVIPKHGDLSRWAEQGVFLLNSILTVPHGTPGGHRGIGWGKFTDEVIAYLSNNHEGIVFMLWGNFAKAKKVLIDADRHLILESAHPSPLARDAFQGCKHFSKANDYLVSCGKSSINWQLRLD